MNGTTQAMTNTATSVDEIGHNPYELASYLSAKYHVYTREQVQAELREIFEAQYELTLTEGKWRSATVPKPAPTRRPGRNHQ